MFGLVWTTMKAFGRFIKINLFSLVLGTLFITMSGTLVSINKQLTLIERQNLQSYNTQAEINTIILNAIQLIAEYSLSSEQADLQRDSSLAQFLQELDNKVASITVKVQKTDTESLNRDKQIGDYIQAAEQKPAYEYMKSMIVYLVEQSLDDEFRGSIGTGTVIKVTDTETYILTNKHVCDWAENTTCYVFQDKVKYKIELVQRNEVDHDIQIVKTSVAVPNKQAIRGIKDVVEQEKVYCVGNNNGNPFMYSEGTVSGFSRDTGDLIVGMPSGPGNSGSGIFTKDGYLTGILYAGQVFSVAGDVSLDTAHAICINSKILRLFLSEYFK